MRGNCKGESKEWKTRDRENNQGQWELEAAPQTEGIERRGLLGESWAPGAGQGLPPGLSPQESCFL